MAGHKLGPCGPAYAGIREPIVSFSRSRWSQEHAVEMVYMSTVFRNLAAEDPSSCSWGFHICVRLRTIDDGGPVRRNAGCGVGGNLPRSTNSNALCGRLRWKLSRRYAVSCGIIVGEVVRLRERLKWFEESSRVLTLKSGAALAAASC